MIELNKKTRQDFLDREWVQKLLDAGVDMSDAKYIISKQKDPNNISPWYLPDDTDYVYYKEELSKDMANAQVIVEFITQEIKEGNKVDRICKISDLPTYSTAELLYKLHEWIWPTIDGVEYSGGLTVSKDAPFYFAYYDLHEQGKDNHLTEEFFTEFEYPIESLASLLIQCQKKDIGIANKNINISGK